MYAHDEMTHAEEWPEGCCDCGEARELHSTRIYENEEGFFLTVEAPGSDEDDFETRHRLYGRAPSKYQVEFCLRGKDEVKFQKTFKFPVPVKTESVHLRYDGGFLLIWLPKAFAENYGVEKARA